MPRTPKRIHTRGRVTETAGGVRVARRGVRYRCLIFSPASFAARSIVPATTFGCVMKTAWLAETLVMFAPMRSAI